MPEIASKLVPTFSGVALDGDRVGDAGGKVMMTDSERARVAEAASPIATLTSASAANVIVATTAQGLTVLAGQSVSFVAGATNSGAVTLAINGEPAQPMVNRDGEPLIAGQIVVGALVTVMRSLTGSSYRVTSARPATAAEVKVGSSLVNPVTPAALAPTVANVGRSRWAVDGRVYAVTVGTSKLTVSASQGRVWVENSGTGAPYASIEAVTAVDVPNGQALMVDLDSTPNAFGRYVPFVANPASAANSGWQSGNRILLFSNWSATTGASDADTIYGGGAYKIVIPAPDINPVTLNAQRSRRTIDGRVYKLINNGNGTVTVALSQGRVWKENAAGNIEYRIEAVADTILTTNQAIVADLDSAPNGSGRIVPTVVTNLASGANAGWQSANRIVLFSHTTSGASSSPVDQIYGGGSYLVDITGGAITRDPSLLYVKASSSQLQILCPGAISHYTRWLMVNSVDVEKNCDVWRINGASDATLVNGTITLGQTLLRNGEIETAVKQPGKADFSGGLAHGNQVKSEVVALADGKLFDPTSTLTGFYAKTLDIYQTSALYEYGNAANKIADIYTHWRWTAAGPTISVTAVVSGTETFSVLYFGILAGWRNNGLIDLITKGRRAPPRLGQYEEDLSTSTYTQFNSKAFELVGYGPSGYGFRATKLLGYDDTTAPNRTTYFAPTVDNKFYFNQISEASPETYSDGQVIGPIITEFEISNPY